MEAEDRNILQQLGGTSDSVTRTTNFELTAYMVAPYIILKARNAPVPQIRHLLEDTLQQTMAWSSQAVHEQQQFDPSPEAFESLVGDSGDKEKNFYEEPDFKLRRARDLPKAYSLEVHKCWYTNKLEQLGAREIRPSFCAFDRACMTH